MLLCPPQPGLLFPYRQLELLRALVKWMMKACLRPIVFACLFTAFFSTYGPTSLLLAQESTSSSITGTWDGSWYCGSKSGNITFVLSENSDELVGTIAATNVRRFGNEPVPLSEANFEGGHFRFRAIGKDGAPVYGSLKIEGGKMTGRVTHRRPDGSVGCKVDFRLRKGSD